MVDSNKLLCGPCFGNGNIILLYIIYNRIKHKIDLEIALKTTYVVELFQDNIDECKDRIINLLDLLGIEYNKDLAKQIMDENLICHDFFTWNFEEWREYTQAELDYLEKQKNKKEYDDGIVQEALF